MIAERAWWNTYHIFVSNYPEKSLSRQVSLILPRYMLCLLALYSLDILFYKFYGRNEGHL